MTGLGLSKLAYNIFKTLSRQLGSGVIQFLTIAIIAHSFGPEGNGTYSVALLLPTMLASLLNLGVSPANVYFLGSGKVSVKEAWKKTLALYCGISLAGLLLGAVIILNLGSAWFPGIPSWLLWFSLVIFPFSLLLNFVSSFYQGLQLFDKFNAILLLHPCVTLIGVFALTVSGLEQAGGLLSAYLLGVVATVVLALIYIQPVLDYEGKEELKQSGYIKLCISYGIKSHLSNVLTIVNYKADIFLVNFLVGPGAAGVYVVAVQIAERLWILSTAVSTVLLPRLAQLSSDEDLRRAITPIICRWVLLSTLTASLLLLVISPLLVKFIFGSEFHEVTNLLTILTPGVVLWAGARVLSNDIAARNKPEVNFYISSLVLVVNIAGNFVFIPKYGILGAAGATSFCYFVDFLAKAICYTKISRCSPIEFILPQLEDVKMAGRFFYERK